MNKKILVSLIVFALFFATCFCFATDNIVMKVIYSFHMPLFIAISGYLFWFSVKNHGMFNSIKKRVARLLPVCLTWAIILSLVDFKPLL